MGELPAGILDAEAVAEHLGVSHATINQYVARGDITKPDGHIAGRPWWHEATIRAWITNRPGRGAGGGRPRKG